MLATTLVLSRLFAPDTQWANTARQARAATLYVLNWVLASDSVDYLAAENAPSPVQHFWSLSVEEQFYFVWPILILVMVLAARRFGWNRDIAVLAGLAVLVTASLGYSIWETAHNPPAAYFVTPTRMWELGIGGLLAVVVAVRQRRGLGTLLPATPRVVLAWLGLAAIAWTAWTYTSKTPFPGWQALVPVLGTALVIGAAAPMSRLSPGPLLAVRPGQWLGDVSYSVYLWHWPLIVLVPQMLDHQMNNLDRIVILALTLVLAGLTKKYVEDRFRAPQWGKPLRKPFLLGAAGMVVVLALAGMTQLEVDRREATVGGPAQQGPLRGRSLLRCRRPGPRDGLRRGSLRPGRPGSRRRGDRQVRRLRGRLRRQGLLGLPAPVPPGALHVRGGGQQDPRGPPRQLARRPVAPGPADAREEERLAGRHLPRLAVREPARRPGARDQGAHASVPPLGGQGHQGDHRRQAGRSGDDQPHLGTSRGPDRARPATTPMRRGGPTP